MKIYQISEFLLGCSLDKTFNAHIWKCICAVSLQHCNAKSIRLAPLGKTILLIKKEVSQIKMVIQK